MATGDNISGINGKISVGAVEYEVTNFNVSVSGSTIGVTDGSDRATGFRRKLPGKFKEWSGDAELFLKIGDAEIECNSDLAFVGTAETGVTYTGQICVTEVGDAIPVEAEEAVQVSISFEGLGALTKANPAVA